MNHTDLTNKLKEKQLRVTRARLEIFDLLKKSDRSLSAQEIYQNLGNQNSTDLASVYRNLNLFYEMGLAHRFQNGSYSLCHQSPQQQDSHVHLIHHCTTCGKEREVEKHDTSICQIADQLKKVCNILQTLSEITISGECKECSSNQKR